MINFQSAFQKNLAFSAQRKLPSCTQPKAPKDENGKVNWEAKVKLMSEQNAALRKELNTTKAKFVSTKAELDKTKTELTKLNYAYSRLEYRKFSDDFDRGGCY